MDDIEFDRAMIAAAFTQAALTGWRGLSVVEAARVAGLPLDRARARFPGAGAVLLRFGLMADQAALAEPLTEPSARERLFDLIMRRIDVLQQHRDGMVALLRDLPRDPALALLLSGATLRSMAWLLEVAGVSAQGVRGQIRANGLVAVWLYVVRAWKDDISPDLSATMAALDKALDRAEQLSSLLRDPPGMAPLPALDPEMGVDVGVPSDSPIDPSDAAFNPPPPPIDEPGAPLV